MNSAMRRVSALASLVLALTACGEEAPPPDPELPPLVGGLEVPISLRNDGRTPTNALRIEIGMGEMHVDSHALFDMTGGRPADSEVTPAGYPALLQRVQSLPARDSAALTIYATVPYGTMVRVMQTLLAAGYHEFSFAVRTPDASPTIRWLTITSPEVVPSEGDVPMEGTVRPWSDFTSHWSEVYDACRSGHYVDCDGLPAVAAPGGNLQLELWTRGSGMILRFDQIDVGDAGVPAAPTVEMLPGVPQPESGDDPPPRPFTTGAFSFRAEEATEATSAISGTTRPVCATAICPTVVVADDITQTMRVISLLGAAFPNGTTAPRLAFRLPE
jgi:hypothetical protein